MTRALRAAFALSAFPHEDMDLCKGAKLPTRAMLQDDPMEYSLRFIIYMPACGCRLRSGHEQWRAPIAYQMQTEKCGLSTITGAPENFVLGRCKLHLDTRADAALVIEENMSSLAVCNFTDPWPRSLTKARASASCGRLPDPR
jgi:hypothetical protein